jgi:hypothetical protein
MSAGALGAAAFARPAALVSASDIAARSDEHGGPRIAGFVDAVLDAFEAHRLVAYGEVHGLQEGHDALAALLTDPRFHDVVDDVVIELGNSLFQDEVDHLVASGAVENVDLRPVWRNTTNSPLATGDEPVYEGFFRLMRALNWRLPAERRVRTLLGDPPIDWPKITTADQIVALRNQRDAFAAHLVEREVLARSRRALILYGAGHVLHQASTPAPAPSTIVSLIEQRTGQRVFSIVTLVPLAGDPGGLASRLASYPRGVVIPTAGTWLGMFDAGDVFPAIAPGPSGRPVNPNCGVPLGSLTDAGLYLGPPGDLTMSRPNPAIYLDEAYWAELQRRNALQGGVVDLSQLRREQSIHFTPEPVPPELLCQ